MLTDMQKLRRLATNHALTQTYLVGHFLTPGFTDFIWGGLISPQRQYIPKMANPKNF